MTAKKELQQMAPALTGQPYNQAEALGSALWLWMQSDFHKDFPLRTLDVLLLPAIASGQFIMIFEDKQPVCFLSWAGFSEDAEKRYLENPLVEIRKDDWQSGNRTWILDWITPFGHTPQLLRLTEKLMHNRYVRWMYHKGDGSKDIIKEFWGISIPKEEAKYWFSTHPALTPDYLERQNNIITSQ